MKKLPKDVDGRNGERAYWAASAISAYLGRGDKPGGIEAAIKAWQECTKCDEEDVARDLLCDLHHWCDRNGVDYSSRVIWETAKELPEDTTVEFLRALRQWCSGKRISYKDELRKAKYNYEAETGKVPY